MGRDTKKKGREREKDKVLNRWRKRGQREKRDNEHMGKEKERHRGREGETLNR